MQTVYRTCVCVSGCQPSFCVQAEEQLGPGWTLMRGGTPSCPEIPDWLADNLGDGGRVGIDPFLHTVGGFAQHCTLAQGELHCLTPDWLADNLGGGGRVGIDPLLHSVRGHG